MLDNVTESTDVDLQCKKERSPMKLEKLITTLLLLLPGLSWGPPGSVVPEPGILPLLAAGGVVAVAARLMRRKK